MVSVQSTALHAANHCFNGLPNGLVALLDFSTGADDDFIAFGKLTFHDAAADDAASKLGRACTGAVDVEGTGNVHDGALVLGPVGCWNGGLNGVDEDVKVDVMMSRDGDHRGVLCDGSLEERFDLGVGLHGPFLGNQVDFVLNDDDVLDACDLKGHQVFSGLGLWTGFVGGHHQHGTVHDGGPVIMMAISVSWPGASQRTRPVPTLPQHHRHRRVACPWRSIGRFRPCRTPCRRTRV